VARAGPCRRGRPRVSGMCSAWLHRTRGPTAVTDSETEANPRVGDGRLNREDDSRKPSGLCIFRRRGVSIVRLKNNFSPESSLVVMSHTQLALPFEIGSGGDRMAEKRFHDDADEVAGGRVG
jgi:hypothetical protein